MNRLSAEDRVQMLACLVEGNSIRSTCRMTGIGRQAAQRFGEDLGAACEKFAAQVMVNLPCTRIQCDEIWAFCGAKGTRTMWDSAAISTDYWPEMSLCGIGLSPHSTKSTLIYANAGFNSTKHMTNEC